MKKPSSALEPSGHARRHMDSTPEQGAGIAPLFVSVIEAGAALGIGRSKAWELVRSGQLPTVRLDRRVLVPVKALEQFAAALEAKSA